jgi:hypothetical protein
MQQYGIKKIKEYNLLNPPTPETQLANPLLRNTL